MQRRPGDECWENLRREFPDISADIPRSVAGIREYLGVWFPYVNVPASIPFDRACALLLQNLRDATQAQSSYLVGGQRGETGTFGGESLAAPSPARAQSPSRAARVTPSQSPTAVAAVPKRRRTYASPTAAPAQTPTVTSVTRGVETGTLRRLCEGGVANLNRQQVLDLYDQADALGIPEAWTMTLAQLCSSVIASSSSPSSATSTTPARQAFPPWETAAPPFEYEEGFAAPTAASPFVAAPRPPQSRTSPASPRRPQQSLQETAAEEEREEEEEEEAELLRRNRRSEQAPYGGGGREAQSPFSRAPAGRTNLPTGGRQPFPATSAPGVTVRSVSPRRRNVTIASPAASSMGARQNVAQLQRQSLPPPHPPPTSEFEEEAELFEFLNRPGEESYGSGY